MPSVERWRSYRFYFYSREPNEPLHVHVHVHVPVPARGCTAKFWLRPVALVRNVGFTLKELAELLARVRQRQAALEEAWAFWHLAPTSGSAMSRSAQTR